MRLFLAVRLSADMKDTLIGIQNKWYDAGIRGNYIPEENLHMTLVFIGEYTDEDPVMDALAGVSFTPFPITLEGTGCFGDLWWAGMKDSAPLEAVVRRIRRALSEKDIPFDRKRFRAHITLLRKATGAMPGIRPEPASMTVETISLMRSDRGRTGMIYTEIGTLEAEEL